MGLPCWLDAILVQDADLEDRLERRGPWRACVSIALGNTQHLQVFEAELRLTHADVMPEPGALLVLPHCGPAVHGRTQHNN